MRLMKKYILKDEWKRPTRCNDGQVDKAYLKTESRRRGDDGFDVEASKEAKRVVGDNGYSYRWKSTETILQVRWKKNWDKECQN